MTFTGSKDESPARAIGLALHHVKAAKPNDRSEKDRAYAVTITELEKAQAYFLRYAADDEVRRLFDLGMQAQADQEQG